MSKYNNKQTFFDLIVCDFDTALFKSARMVEEDYVIIRNKKTGLEMEYPNKTLFWGRSEKTITGDLGKWCDFIGWNASRDDYEIESHVRIKKEYEDDPLEHAFREFNKKVGSIKNANIAQDYLLVIGGTLENFRYEEAKIQPYKGKRKEKPLIFQDLKDKVVSQYRSRIKLAEGCEADDVLGWYATENQREFTKTGKYPYILAYIDKDLKQLWGASINIENLTQGIEYITPKEAVKYLCIQLLKGDKATDNILGLGKLSEETREMYGLRKGSGVGDVAANTILDSAKTSKEMLIRVVDAYKKSYPEKTLLDDGLTEYTWKDFLRENAILLWMQRFENEKFDIIQFLEKELKLNLDDIDLHAVTDESGKKQIINKTKEEIKNV